MRHKGTAQATTRVLFVLLATFFLTSEPFAELGGFEYLYSLDKEMYGGALIKGEEHSRGLIDGPSMQGERDRLSRGLRCRQILVAEGDSWFNYPLRSDILGQLRNLEWVIYSSAHYGDTMESMLYDNGQLESIYRNLILIALNDSIPKEEYVSENCLIENRYVYPKAILLSMGGNDILGNTLQILLEHRQSSLYDDNNDTNINQDIKNGLFKRMTVTLIEYINTIMHLCSAVYGECDNTPILIHGYDYARPTGKGYRILGINMAGPWIEPALAAKDRLADRSSSEEMEENAVIVELVKEYNGILCNVATFFSQADRQQPVYAVDFQNIVHGAGGWRDEMHPNRTAAEGLARIISTIIQRFHSDSLPENQNCMSGANFLPDQQ